MKARLVLFADAVLQGMGFICGIVLGLAIMRGGDFRIP
jgi:hypothetical protein